MAYVKTVWVDGVTPENAANMNHIEGGIFDAHTDIAGLTTRIAAEEAQPDIPAVVNGKWIKGVGGAMVWSDIVVADVAGAEATANKGAASGYAPLDATSKVPAANLPAMTVTDASLPTRIGIVAKTITDWNNATENGWYMGSGITNQPVADGLWYIGQVTVHDSSYITQRAWQFTAAAGSISWERRKAGGWGPWVPISPVYERRTSLVDVQNTASELSLYNGAAAGAATGWPIAAGVMGIDRTYRLTLLGNYLFNNSGSNTLTLKVRLGNSTRWQHNIINNPGSQGGSRHPIEIRLHVSNRGAANSQNINGVITMESVTQGGPTSGEGVVQSELTMKGGQIGSNASVDTSAATTLDVTAQWSAASVNNSLRIYYALAELL